MRVSPGDSFHIWEGKRAAGSTIGIEMKAKETCLNYFPDFIQPVSIGIEMKAKETCLSYFQGFNSYPSITSKTSISAHRHQNECQGDMLQLLPGLPPPSAFMSTSTTLDGLHAPGLSHCFGWLLRHQPDARSKRETKNLVACRNQQQIVMIAGSRYARLRVTAGSAISGMASAEKLRFRSVSAILHIGGTET